MSTLVGGDPPKHLLILGGKSIARKKTLGTRVMVSRDQGLCYGMVSPCVAWCAPPLGSFASVVGLCSPPDCSAFHSHLVAPTSRYHTHIFGHYGMVP